MTTLTPLTESAARLLTDRIRTGAEQVWTLLQQAHKGKAYAVLGYDTWDAYTTAEFGISRSRAYQLLDQAKVIERVADAAGMSTDVDNLGITEAAARDIAPDVDLITQTIAEAVGETSDPDERRAKVREIVEDYRAKQAERKLQPPKPHPGKGPDPSLRDDRRLPGTARRRAPDRLGPGRPGLRHPALPPVPA